MMQRLRGWEIDNEPWAASLLFYLPASQTWSWVSFAGFPDYRVRFLILVVVTFVKGACRSLSEASSGVLGLSVT